MTPRSTAGSRPADEKDRRTKTTPAAYLARPRRRGFGTVVTTVFRA
jgi:hypothetical protein